MQRRLQSLRFIDLSWSFARSWPALASLAHKARNLPRRRAPSRTKPICKRYGTRGPRFDPPQEAQFHAQGRTRSMTIASQVRQLAEFQSGCDKILGTIKSGTFTVNDDAQLHPAGDYVWGTATVKEDLVMKDGKRDMATLRLDVVFEKQDGKWLIVHEHISAPGRIVSHQRTWN